LGIPVEGSIVTRFVLLPLFSFTLFEHFLGCPSRFLGVVAGASGKGQTPDMASSAKQHYDYLSLYRIIG
jgi:hypothetical protein